MLENWRIVVKAIEFPKCILSLFVSLKVMAHFTEGYRAVERVAKLQNFLKKLLKNLRTSESTVDP